ncbi:HugZ family protein [Baaleninema sp.]|uniref:HugZ family pyridoxamine 5'-phosphate oxidase n=1 Tax=Baaleninema sp. TaxID=3101197 RepID=UPI003D01E94E
MSSLETAQVQYREFLRSRRSLMLATVDASAKPNASYTPFVTDERHHFYIYVSGLSSHTKNLMANPQASILLIEDESNTEEIFARRRLSFDCHVLLIERESESWNLILDRFRERCGEIIDVLRNLADFQLFRLTPTSGRFVLGFGAAYDVDSEAFDRLVPVKPKSQS